MGKNGGLLAFATCRLQWSFEELHDKQQAGRFAKIIAIIILFVFLYLIDYLMEFYLDY